MNIIIESFVIINIMHDINANMKTVQKTRLIL